jgi:hypothetical protein
MKAGESPSVSASTRADGQNGLIFAACFLCSSELARLREAMEKPGLTLWMASAISSVRNGFLHFQ